MVKMGGAREVCSLTVWYLACPVVDWEGTVCYLGSPDTAVVA